MLLLVLGWHTFTETVVICFESNGDVNIETHCDLDTSYSSSVNLDLHIEYNGKVHHSQNGHTDVSISEISPMLNKTIGLDRDLALKLINEGLFSSASFFSDGAVSKLQSYVPPNVEQPSITLLQTIVLLN